MYEYTVRFMCSVATGSLRCNAQFVLSENHAAQSSRAGLHCPSDLRSASKSFRIYGTKSFQRIFGVLVFGI